MKTITVYQTIKELILVVCLALLVCSCGKDSTRETTPIQPIQQTPPTHTHTDVYVAGDIEEGGSTHVATFWKNGIPTALSAPGNDAWATSVFVSGNDVYVTGAEMEGPSMGYNKPLARLWKNGISIPFSSENVYGFLNSVYVSGNDVYVAGRVDSELNVIKSSARIWKNGTVTILYDDYYGSSEANSVFVSGSDVYVAGGIRTPGSSSYEGQVWKNGNPIPLTTSVGGTTGNSVYVSGNDVYIAGLEGRSTTYASAVLWKNGVAIPLGNGSFSNALSVFVSGNNVYVAGAAGTYPFSYAKVWKNNVETALTNGSYASEASSVFVSGEDVYIAGRDRHTSFTNFYASIWKNSVPTALTDSVTGSTYLSSIYVNTY